LEYKGPEQSRQIDTLSGKAKKRKTPNNVATGNKNPMEENGGDPKQNKTKI